MYTENPEFSFTKICYNITVNFWWKTNKKRIKTPKWVKINTGKWLLWHQKWYGTSKCITISHEFCVEIFSKVEFLHRKVMNSWTCFIFEIPRFWISITNFNLLLHEDFCHTHWNVLLTKSVETILDVFLQKNWNYFVTFPVIFVFFPLFSLFFIFIPLVHRLVMVVSTKYVCEKLSLGLFCHSWKFNDHTIFQQKEIPKNV